MHLNNFFLRSFRILLFPFALLYGAVVVLRNLMYDKSILKSGTFNIPIIGVGNLSVGGTGKSPMVEYLAGLLKEQYNVATLSRGYKRRTKGYLLASGSTTALEIGDEPMQFYLKHPEISVAVGESRTEAIPQLLYDRPSTEVIILDDAFQHRAIRAGLNILLTDCQNLYVDDFFLPTGDLRDQPGSAARADILVVTKCRPDLNEAEANRIRRALKPLANQEVFFTTIRYGQPYHIVNRENRPLHKNLEVLLVCGIANPEPLKNFLLEETNTYDACYYGDHHIFTIDDLREIRTRFEAMDAPEKMIITTEKDAVRLLKFGDELKDMPFYVLPIGVSFLFAQARRFNDLIVHFIRTFSQGKPGPLDTKKPEGKE
jgi:tetraacyldisaccharide 4'-kinase